MATVNRRIALVRRPEGLPRASDFQLEEEPLGELPPDSVRVAVEHLSIDAFIRTMLEDVGYHGSIPIGGTVAALGVGRVLESNVPDLAPGDAVRGMTSAQTVATVSSMPPWSMSSVRPMS